MNKYVVGYCSLNTGSLSLITSYDVTELAALNNFLGTDFATVDEIREYCSNTDSFIEVLKL